MYISFINNNTQKIMKNFSNFICLEGSSQVWTKNGILLIKDIIPGMEVLSYDEETKELVEDFVVATARSRHSLYATLLFENEMLLRCTIDHPILADNKGWSAVSVNGMKDMYDVTVKQLKVGDICPLFKDNSAILSRLKSITIDSCSDYFYCFSTQKYHNFLANGFVVHDVNTERFSKEFFLKEGVEIKRS